MARLRIAVAGLVGLVVAASIVAPAQAAFPGGNGKIAFETNRDGNYEIYTVNRDGSNPTNLTNNPAYDQRPSWSADGKKIAFQSSRDGGSFEIYTMNADGTGQTRITNNSDFDEFPAWSPDGTKIVFASDRHSLRDIYTMNADGTNVVRLTTDPGFDSYPVWSPDGTKIAWTSNRSGGQFDIFKMNADGTGPTNLTNNPAIDELPDWSPNGSKIIFDTDRNGPGVGDIYEMSADGTSQVGLVNGPNNSFAPVYAPTSSLEFAFTELQGSDNDIATFGTSYSSGTNNVTQNGVDDAYPDWQQVKPAYIRPKDATPVSLPLVPAFRVCSPPNSNRMHGPPLEHQSCAPPVQESTFLTVGSPDANGQPAESEGFVTYSTIAGAPGGVDDADVALTFRLTDVRERGVPGPPNYRGSLGIVTTERITDRLNGPSANEPATLIDVPLTLTAPCTPTSPPTIGSTCTLSTTFDTIVPGAIAEGKRTVMGFQAVSVTDGGSDGDPQTSPASNRPFARPGIFVP